MSTDALGLDVFRGGAGAGAWRLRRRGVGRVMAR